VHTWRRTVLAGVERPRELVGKLELEPRSLA
jgi:hypothetical protein